MTDVWDDPAFNASNFIKLEEEGDKFYGELIGVHFEEVTTTNGTGRFPVLEVRIDDEEKTYTAMSAVVREKLRRMQPQIGSMIGIKRGKKIKGSNAVDYDVINHAKVGTAVVDAAGQAEMMRARAAAEQEAPF